MTKCMMKECRSGDLMGSCQRGWMKEGCRVQKWGMTSLFVVEVDKQINLLGVIVMGDNGQCFDYSVRLPPQPRNRWDGPLPDIWRVTWDSSFQPPLSRKEQYALRLSHPAWETNECTRTKGTMFPVSGVFSSRIRQRHSVSSARWVIPYNPW